MRSARGRSLLLICKRAPARMHQLSLTVWGCCCFAGHGILAACSHAPDRPVTVSLRRSHLAQFRSPPRPWRRALAASSPLATAWRAPSWRTPAGCAPECLAASWPGTSRSPPPAGSWRRRCSRHVVLGRLLHGSCDQVQCMPAWRVALRGVAAHCMWHWACWPRSTTGLLPAAARFWSWC